MDKGIEVIFVQCHPQFAYFVGDTATLPEKMARMLIAEGCCELSGRVEEEAEPKPKKARAIKK